MANWFDRVGDDLLLVKFDLARLKEVVAARRMALKNFTGCSLAIVTVDGR